ncbi:chitinase [Nocardia brasiliensis]|uniref:Chitinase n=1 Tax=Nocardia brasiliensis (strain ATCC 700358 / HUJEG-1) TaxID=1133849 RepID=K0F7G5_NOCB7|nr:chitinase [Nocardia brasiliensis]AFU05300.1 chitinase [Nocardia brasiliensis ATCC 700358]
MKKRLAILLGVALACGTFSPLVAAPEAVAADCLVTLDEFTGAVQAAGYPAPSREQYDNMCGQSSVGNIPGREPFAEFLAQAIYASDGLRSKREYNCAQSGCPGEYETPDCDIHNQDYYGRGYIRIAGCPAYKEASQEIYGDDRLVEDADGVARDDKIAWATAFWFWKAKVTTAPGYGTGFGYTTNAINGSLECSGPTKAAERRYEIYTLVAKSFDVTPIGDKGCNS